MHQAANVDGKWSRHPRQLVYQQYHRLQDWLLRAQVTFRNSIRLVYGPERVEAGSEELVVLCLERNGELWMRSFIEHYRALGVRHIVFLDNGSTDRSIELARQYDRVSIWSTQLPFRHYEHAFRRWLTHRFGNGCWALHADIDELWEYPGSDVVDLTSFLRYLNEHDYQVVVAQMLDMFSDVPFDSLTSEPDDDLKRKYPFYDLEDVETTTDVYWIDEARRHGASHFCTFGGIRKRVFGSEGLMQTKHPLTRAGAGVEVYPYDGHFVTGGRIADVSTLLRHYKLVGRLHEQAGDALRLRQHSGGSRHYRGFHQVLNEHPDLCLYSERARELRSADELVAAGFLTISPRYEAWIRACAGAATSPSAQHHAAPGR